MATGDGGSEAAAASTNYDDMYADSEVASTSNTGLKRRAAQWLCTDELSALANSSKVAKKEGSLPMPLPNANVTSEADVIRGQRKIYVGSLPPSITEKPLVAHFRAFGHVVNCTVVRDKETGISRGFAFLTFLCETEAEAAVNYGQHTLDGKPIRVSLAQTPGGTTKMSSKKKSSQEILDTVQIPEQLRVYVGPLEESVNVNDLSRQMAQFGAITGISKIKAPGNSFGFVDYREVISIRRAFASGKIFIKGKHVKVALSKLAIELVLSETVVFFYEAHLYCDNRHLEQHFSQYGQIFRVMHLPQEESNKTYGFVDFVRPESVDKALAQKSQLMHPGQYVRVGKILPQALLYDLLAIGDKQGGVITRKLEMAVPEQGVWGSHVRQEQHTTSSSSQVRLPAKLVPKLIGERGKTISEICRDSKTKITIPKVHDDSPTVIITVTGTKGDIKTAQYLMQKLLKPK